MSSYDDALKEEVFSFTTRLLSVMNRKRFLFMLFHKVVAAALYGLLFFLFFVIVPNLVGRGKKSLHNSHTMETLNVFTSKTLFASLTRKRTMEIKSLFTAPLKMEIQHCFNSLPAHITSHRLCHYYVTCLAWFAIYSALLLQKRKTKNKKERKKKNAGIFSFFSGSCLYKYEFFPLELNCVCSTTMTTDVSL